MGTGGSVISAASLQATGQRISIKLEIPWTRILLFCVSYLQLIMTFGLTLSLTFDHYLENYNLVLFYSVFLMIGKVMKSSFLSYLY